MSALNGFIFERVAGRIHTAFYKITGFRLVKRVDKDSGELEGYYWTRHYEG
jgi:hypothetical protein